MMSSSVSSYERPRNVQNAATQRRVRETESDSESTYRGFSLSFSQVAILWSLMAGLLLMSFLFGFYAGREQGLRVAFEQYSGQAVRIPIAGPIASASSSHNATPSPAVSDASRTGSTVGAADDEVEFDFSPSSKLSASAGVASSGEAEVVQPSTQEKPAPAVVASEQSKPLSLQEVRPVSSLAPGWYIQVAASKTRDDADVIAAKMKAHDYQAAVEVAEVGGQQYFRVLVGVFDSRAAAEQARLLLAKKKLSSAVPFLKKIS